MAQLAKVQAVRFDVQQFQWLGSTGPDGDPVRDPRKPPLQELQGPAERQGGDRRRHDRSRLELARRSAAAEGIRRRQIQADRGLPGQRRHPPGARARRSGRLVGAVDAGAPGGGRRRRAAAGARPQSGQGIRSPAGRRGPDAARHRQVAHGHPRHPARDRQAVRGAAGRAGGPRRDAAGRASRRSCAIRSSWPTPRRSQIDIDPLTAEQVTKGLRRHDEPAAGSH